MIRSYLKNPSGLNSIILAACPNPPKADRLTPVKHQNLFGSNPLKILEFRQQIIFKTASKYNKKYQQGFIALISVIIISLLLVTISITVATTGFLSRFNILDTENKQRSAVLAEACLDVVLLRLAKNSSDTSTGIVSLGTDTCGIYSVVLNSPAANQITIQTKASINNAVTNLKLIVNSGTLTQITLEELPSL